MRLKELQEKFKEKILKEKELLEQPIAVPGNWQGFGDDFEMDISLERFDDLWEEIDNVSIINQQLIIAKLRTENIYIAGFHTSKVEQTKNGPINKPIFRVIFQIALENQESIGNNLGYNDLYSVKAVYVSEDFRNRGVAATIYKWFVNKLGINILGDKHQFFGARKLWTYLSNQIDIQVDLVDLNTNDVIEKDIIIYHGKKDNEIDQSIWSFDEEKANIRPILTKIL